MKLIFLSYHFIRTEKNLLEDGSVPIPSLQGFNQLVYLGCRPVYISSCVSYRSEVCVYVATDKTLLDKRKGNVYLYLVTKLYDRTVV